VNLQAIEAIVRAVDIPVQVGGGLRDRDRVAALLKLGVQRAIWELWRWSNPT
jgi:phosphoribosylformimino-5-aminoimidazole carboxamide ribotide isomerase